MAMSGSMPCVAKLGVLGAILPYPCRIDTWPCQDPCHMQQSWKYWVLSYLIPVGLTHGHVRILAICSKAGSIRRSKLLCFDQINVGNKGSIPHTPTRETRICINDTCSTLAIWK